ncbi:MAG: cell wall hydrolase [Dethiobacter sp.]|jgi:N-acetylmuramoyl-L-alanine amidase|nr:cell wall hydrolase [Dethiobacter sp.]MBS4023997.1 cell wall hydrolase [Dethiobacter sp.]
MRKQKLFTQVTVVFMVLLLAMPVTSGAVAGFRLANNLLLDDIIASQTMVTGRLIQNEEGQAEEGLGSDEQTAVVAADEKQEDDVEKIENEFNFTSEEIDLFARLVHAEAAGEPYEGKVAVAASVLNRLRSSRYPNTLRGVIYQISGGRYQYSPVLDGRINRSAGSGALKAVEDAINGWDPTNGASGFFNPRKTSNQWVRSQPVTRTIGRHVFFK